MLPEKRPPIEDLLKEPIISGVLQDWDSYLTKGVINKRRGKEGEDLTTTFEENHEDVLLCIKKATGS